MPTENDSSIHQKVAQGPDGQEVAIPYVSRAKTESAESDAKIQAAAERLVLLLTRNPGNTNYDSRRFDYRGEEAIIAQGTSPTVEYGYSVKSESESDTDETTYKPAKPGEFGYPTRNLEEVSTDHEELLKKNRIMLDKIVEIAMKLKDEREADYRANRYLNQCAQESGLGDDPRISTFQGIRLSDGRYETTHWRCAFYPKGSDTRELGWVTTGGKKRYDRSQMINALHVIDFSEMEEYMSKPRSPIELIDAFFLTLERSSIAVRSELSEKADAIWEQRMNSRIFRIRDNLGLAN